MDDITYKIYERDTIGEVRVTEDVIAIIAGLAATEVEGVYSLANNITKNIISKLGRKDLSAGVEVSVAVDIVSVSLSLVVIMGYYIPDVTKEVQEKVKNAIEGMTGLKVNAVDINIANVKVEKD